MDGQAERAVAPQSERRALKMHPRLLWDVIHRQAGSLSKSVLEGVMNSIDAAGSRCDIELDQRRLVIVDDGRGFVDRTEIENFFETFGYPHEEGDATYGRFRMGRGQLFAAGRNVWKTNDFVMEVDLKPQEGQRHDEFSLGYTLTEGAGRNSPGCRIEVDLYEPMNQWMLSTTIRSIAENVAWAQVPVTINGSPVSRRPAEAKWDIETDDAYVSLNRSGTLAVYNLGVLVCHVPSSKLGTGGTVVTKRKLDVNFARNAIQGTCEVWKRVAKDIQAVVGREVVRKEKLDDAGREMLAHGIVDGAIDIGTVLKQRIVTDVTGSHRQLQSISPSGHQPVPVAVASTGDRVGDIVMQRKLALVLSQETLDRFQAPTLQAFLDRLVEACDRDLEARGISPGDWRSQDPVNAFRTGILRLRPVTMDGFRASITDDHIPVDAKALKPGERQALAALQFAAQRMALRIRHYCVIRNLPEPASRQVLAGTSDTALAWTDGERHIWFERRQLRQIRSPAGRLKLASIMVHEFLHREPDTQTHVHDAAFYQLFHDLAIFSDTIHGAAEEMRAAWDQKNRKAERRAGVDDVPVAEDFGAPGEMAETPEEEGTPAPGR